MRMITIKPAIITAAKALAIILASAVALFALRLFSAGVPLTVVAEVPEGTQQLSGVVNANYMPYPFAVVPLVAMILFIGGLLKQKLLISWIGWAILCIFSVLFLFSSGAALLPAVGILLFLLIPISYARKHPR
jgi:hypothetical protein